MIIAEFDIERIAALEREAYAPLVVNAYGVLSSSVAFEPMQLVARRLPEVIHSCSSIYREELAPRATNDFRWKSLAYAIGK